MPRDTDKPRPPELARDFREAEHPPPEAEPYEPDHDDDGLDHLEYTLDYTPGGSIEQLVNTQLSERARAEYRARRQPAHEDDAAYERLVNRQFERAAADEEAQRLTELARDEGEGLTEEFNDRRQAEIEKLVAGTDREPADWSDDPQKAAEYQAWSREQAAERSEAEHEQTLDRIQEQQPAHHDAPPTFSDEQRDDQEASYPRLYREPERAADPEAADAAEWSPDAGEAGVRDAWDRTAGPDLSHGDAWGSPGGGSGGHEHG